MAASCYPCNSAYKKDWDPRGLAGVSASREELVDATREYVSAKRAAEQRTLDEVRSLVGWMPNAD